MSSRRRTRFEPFSTFLGAGPLAFQERFTEVPERRVTEDRADLVEAAWKLRDELQAANALVRAREYGVRAARGSMAPAVGVEAGADYARPNPLFIPPIDDFRTSWNVTAVASWTPDGTWAASRAKERAVAVLAEAQEQRQQLRDLIKIEVVRAYVAYEASIESVRRREEAGPRQRRKRMTRSAAVSTWAWSTPPRSSMRRSTQTAPGSP